MPGTVGSQVIKYIRSWFSQEPESTPAATKPTTFTWLRGSSANVAAMPLLRSAAAPGPGGPVLHGTCLASTTLGAKPIKTMASSPRWPWRRRCRTKWAWPPASWRPWPAPCREGPVAPGPACAGARSGPWSGWWWCCCFVEIPGSLVTAGCGDGGVCMRWALLSESQRAIGIGPSKAMSTNPKTKEQRNKDDDDEAHNHRIGWLTLIYCWDVSMVGWVDHTPWAAPRRMHFSPLVQHLLLKGLPPNLPRPRQCHSQFSFRRQLGDGQ